MNIHKTALVHPDAVIEEDVDIGPYTIIGPDVKIGKGAEIGARVIIEGDTQIGQNCQIWTGAIIGNLPQDLKFKREISRVLFGEIYVIREYVTIIRGTTSTE